MTDIHTHILPGMDDGAQDLDQAVAMLEACRVQGVDTVVLTPHFYPWMESLDSFLQRRQRSYEMLKAAAERAPRLLLGAEIAWYPGLDALEHVEALAIEGSSSALVEMPNTPWTQTVMDSIYRMSAMTGVTPILAHVERYAYLQKQGQLQALSEVGVLLQMSVGMLLHPLKRRKAQALLKQGTWVFGSDCHDTESRPPCMGKAIRYLPQSDSLIVDWQP